MIAPYLILDSYEEISCMLKWESHMVMAYYWVRNSIDRPPSFTYQSDPTSETTFMTRPITHRSFHGDTAMTRPNNFTLILFFLFLFLIVFR